jgi:hypothetical protein
LIYLKDAFENAQILTPQAGRKSDPPRPLFCLAAPQADGRIGFLLSSSFVLLAASPVMH